MSIIKKVLYRIVHAGLHLTAKFVPFPVPQLLVGAGSVRKLPAEVKARGLKNILIVTGNTVRKMPQFAQLLSALDEQQIRYVVFSNLQANPTIENVEAARETYLSSKCDGIIAFGGGSPMDCAKAAAARVTNSKSVKSMAGLFKLRRKIPPFFAVPTTAGTGSEVTIVAVITDPENHAKFAISDPRLVPLVAVLDPEVMAGLPPAITGTTGMDALTHAVEAYVGVSGTSKTNRYAEDAVKMIFENLEKAYRNGSDMEAREKMALASFYAGAAFTKASVGYVHAIAHKLGGMYGVAHGLANAVVLPYVLEYFGSSAHRKLAKLAVISGTGRAGEKKDVLARKFIARIKEMNRNMGIPDSIPEIKQEDIPVIAASAIREGNPMYPVPRIMTEEECQALIAKVMK
ncbi:MAG: iron-containing alcohol dehydrogenase [Spirochaetota bacterium]